MGAGGAMSRELDGTGGGYGRYAGVTLAEIERLFGVCRQDPTMRGVSAVLRIAREQLDARGGLGSYPWLAGLAGALALLGFVAMRFLPESFVGQARTAEAAVVVVFLLLVGVSVTTAKDRKQGLYQERRIREMALETLEAIVTTEGFRPKSLDETQKLTLERLLRATKREPGPLRQLMS